MFCSPSRGAAPLAVGLCLLGINRGAADEVTVVCEALFGHPHSLMIEIESVNQSGSDSLFFSAAPGVEIVGTVLRDGRETTYRAHLTAPSELFDGIDMRPGDRAVLDVELKSIDSLKGETVLYGLIVSTSIGEQPTSRPADVEASADVSWQTQVLAPATQDSVEPAPHEQRGGSERARLHSSPYIEPVLRRWERDALPGIKAGRALPPPPEMNGRIFRCALYVPRSASSGPRVPARGYNPRTLSPRDALTEDEKIRLERLQYELEQALPETDPSVLNRRNRARMERLEGLRCEGRKLLAVGALRIDQAGHRFILDNLEEMPARNVLDFAQCFIRVESVSVATDEPLPVLVIEGSLVE